VSRNSNIAEEPESNAERDETIQKVVQRVLEHYGEPSGCEYISRETVQGLTSADLWEKYLTSQLRSGGEIKAEAIATDVHGEFDVEYNNPGPVISPRNQQTSAPYLSLVNREELASKRRLERYRTLCRVPADVMGDEMRAEFRELDDASSVSSVSVTSAQDFRLLVGKDPPPARPCSIDCWLKVHGIADTAGNMVLSAQTSDLYTRVSLLTCFSLRNKRSSFSMGLGH
jgi:hypothetical protein